MKFLNMFFVSMMTLIFSVLAFAQDELPVPVPDVTETQFLQDLLSALGGSSGLTAIGIAVVVLQLAFKFIGTPQGKKVFGKFSAKAKFIVVGVLSLAGLVIAQMQSAGVPFSVAVLHGTVVLALMNYGYRFYELFVEKKK